VRLSSKSRATNHSCLHGPHGRPGECRRQAQFVRLLEYPTECHPRCARRRGFFLPEAKWRRSHRPLTGWPPPVVRADFERGATDRATTPAYRSRLPATARCCWSIACRAMPRVNCPSRPLLLSSPTPFEGRRPAMIRRANGPRRNIAADFRSPKIISPLPAIFPGFPILPGAVLLDEALHEGSRAPAASTLGQWQVGSREIPRNCAPRR